jgi:HTH-type transcriptional regulator, competence development regulator
MTFGARLRQLRVERKLTQRQLAEQAGVDFSYLSKIENNRLEHTPSIKTLQSLARALAVDELELMELANKVPLGLEAIARDKAALRFFRRATETVKTPEGWQALLDHLESPASHRDHDEHAER